MDLNVRVNAPPGVQHKRTKSSVLKSIVPTNHQRTPTATAPYIDWKEETEIGKHYGHSHGSMLPPDHPHTRLHLREGSGNRNALGDSPRKSADVGRMHTQACGETQKPNRLISFKTSAEMDKVKSPKKKLGKVEDNLMKKSKSYTGLSALLSRPRSSKGLKDGIARQKKDKENQTPPSTADLVPPPIWAQFATQGVQEPPSTYKIPLNDRESVDDDMRRHMLGGYSPSKQRNSHDFQKPTSSARSEAKPRPRSECLAPPPTREGFLETVSGLRRSARDESQSTAASSQKKNDPNHMGSSQRPSTEQRKVSDKLASSGLTVGKRGSRVMAAVAAFNGKGKELPTEPSVNLPSADMDPRVIEAAFETLLDARNVPENTRDKMRSLDTKIKADFINKNTSGSGSASSSEGLGLQSSRPSTGEPSKSEKFDANSTKDGSERATSAESGKMPRPRSRTFTFSKGDQSPSKKQKSERPTSHQRTKSGGLTTSESSKSLTSDGTAQGLSFFNRVNRPPVPGDYIAYLRKVQRPEEVEVGKVHKLRQLLRNETVGWIDTFIAEGGMTEVVDLLYRIIKVEWRVKHEDTLLHETLLCLKGLSTTSSALHQLSEIQPTLFPILLGMLFDKEKKGPSEYTTRTIIINLLSAYLISSTSLDLASRARTLLSYLHDPLAPEEAQAPKFITSIYHPRPYRVWNKELDNVVKEVFWIFLHHVNIIPYPGISPDAHTYTARHLPREHPPVPAAPYIGGVEWDATNYITAHLDLLNGIIAALPTQEERNSLRQELKDSNFEKVMGASFRTCKEKFYGCVHEALSTWVGAAMEDAWPCLDVRQGPKQEVRQVSPKKSPQKKGDAAPRLEMLKLDLGVGKENGGFDDGGWL